MRYKIGIIEDDVKIAELLKERLEKYGFDTWVCQDFVDVAEQVLANDLKLILLDINLPCYDGYFWCKKIRQSSMIPIIFLSARSMDLDQIYAIESLALGAGNFIIYIFAFLFIGYSSWAFLGSRGKQLGIYTILGMSPKQMKKMLFGENMLIGMGALTAGLISGILFSGLFFKLIRNIFVTISFEMYLPIVPIFITLCLFTAMFLVIGFITPYFISSKKIIWFLKSDKSYAENIRLSISRILLSVLLLVMTATAITLPHIENMIGDFWTPVVFLCVVSSIFLITPQIGAVYAEVKRHSKKHLKGINLFADSEVSAALKENEHMMSLNAVLLTMSFLAICALGSMQNNVVKDVENITPFAYMYIERPGNNRALQDIAFLDNELLSVSSIQKVKYDILRKEFTYGFLRESDFNRILSVKGKEHINLSENDVLILPGDSNRDLDKFSIYQEVEELFETASISAENAKVIDQAVSTTGAYQTIYVVNDKSWDRLKAQNANYLYIESFTVYEDSNWLQHLKKAEELEQVLAHDDANYDYSYAFTTLGNYYNTELLMRKLCTFVGFSVSLIFLVASISLIYFRLYTSLEREQKKYDSMYKLGFSTKEMYRTLGRKIKLLLWIPFLIAIIVMWAGILYIDSQSTISSFSMLGKYSIVFIVLYFVFYQIVIRVYRSKFVESL